MCISFGLVAPRNEVEDRFQVKVEGDWGKKDFYPHRQVLAILREKPKEAVLASWSILDDKTYSTHNARSESLLTSRLYANMFKKAQTCIIPGTYFYEYSKKEKMRYRFKVDKTEIFGFAGLYVKDKDDVRVTMITTVPNLFVSEVHSRMPVILQQKDEKNWLSEDSPSKLLGFLKPYKGAMVKEKAVLIRKKPSVTLDSF